MGWETGVSLGASAIGSFATTENAVAQSKATAATAENVSANLANKTSRTLGSLETSFARGGISLDGVGGTQAVFAQAGQQGITDIHRTIDNANASIADTMNKARTTALTGLANAWGKIPAATINSAVQTAWNGQSGPLDPMADSSLPWSTNYQG